jgi:hypothetical protein
VVFARVWLTVPLAAWVHSTSPSTRRSTPPRNWTAIRRDASPADAQPSQRSYSPEICQLGWRDVGNIPP